MTQSETNPKHNLLRPDKIFGLGVFRLLLAISVVIAHSGTLFGHNIIDGIIAVQSFYIISGFLMALILTEKYHSYKLFITNRYLRLYPTYIVVLVLTFLISMLFYLILNDGLLLTDYIKYINIMNLPSFLILLFTNLTIFGQDLVLFLGLNPQTGTLFFTPDFNLVDIPLWKFLLVPQAWTLGLELTFYFIAPFLNKLKSKYLILILLFSIAIRLFSYSTGVKASVFVYRFFPFELAFFTAGMLAYRGYTYLRERECQSVFELLPIKNSKNISENLVYILFLFALLFDSIPIHYNLKMILFYLLVLISLPTLFSQSNAHNIDKRIGDLSYPIYINHRLIIYIVVALSSVQIYHTTLLGIISIIFSIMFAFILVKYIERPFNKLRQKRIIDEKSTH